MRRWAVRVRISPGTHGWPSPQTNASVLTVSRKCRLSSSMVERRLCTPEVARSRRAGGSCV